MQPTHSSRPSHLCLSAQHLLISQYHACIKAASQHPQLAHQLLSRSTNLPGVAQSGQAICLRRVCCRKLPGDWAPAAVGSGESGRKPVHTVASLVCINSRLHLAHAAPTSTYAAHLVPDYARRYGLTEMSLPQHRVFLLVAARRATGALMAGRLLRSTSIL